MCVAMLEVAVQPGVDFVIERGASPWRFDDGDPEGEKRLLLAQEQSVMACRQKADLAPEKAGVYQGPGGAQEASWMSNAKATLHKLASVSDRAAPEDRPGGTER